MKKQGIQIIWPKVRLWVLTIYRNHFYQRVFKPSSLYNIRLRSDAYTSVNENSTPNAAPSETWQNFVSLTVFGAWEKNTFALMALYGDTLGPRNRGVFTITPDRLQELLFRRGKVAHWSRFEINSTRFNWISWMSALPWCQVTILVWWDRG